MGYLRITILIAVVVAFIGVVPASAECGSTSKCGKATACDSCKSKCGEGTACSSCKPRCGKHTRACDDCRPRSGCESPKCAEKCDYKGAQRCDKPCGKECPEPACDARAEKVLSLQEQLGIGGAAVELPGCCCHENYRLLCSQEHCQGKTCCARSEFRLLCDAKPEKKCGSASRCKMSTCTSCREKEQSTCACR